MWARGDNVGDNNAKRPESSLTLEIPQNESTPESEPDEAAPSRRILPSSPKSPAQSQAPRLSASDVNKEFIPLQLHDGHSSWSASSDKQLGSPGSVNDRVFPIRSVVSVDPSQTPSILQGRNSGEHEYFPPGIAAPGGAGKDIAGTSSRQQRPSRSLSEAESMKPSAHTKKQYEPPTPQGRSAGTRKASLSLSQADSDRYGGGSRMQLFSDAGSEQSARDSANPSGTTNTPSIGSRNGADQESLTGLVTARFKHIITAEGHAVITGRDGETLQRCEDEP